MLIGGNIGLGLAVVARIVEQLGGQLRVDSKVNEGSRFSFLIPFATESDRGSSGSSHRSRTTSRGSRDNEIESLVSALQSHPHPLTGSPISRPLSSSSVSKTLGSPGPGSLSVRTPNLAKKPSHLKIKPTTDSSPPTQLRILIVEVCSMNC
jgi:hypothetical protein